MLKSLEEAKAIYLEEIQRYVGEVRLARIKFSQRFGATFLNTQATTMDNFPPYYSGWICFWDTRLRAMEKVLGLTPAEVAQIDKKYGVERPTLAPQRSPDL